MTRTILILLIGFLSSIVAGCSDTNLTHDIPLVPRPAQIVPGSGNYLFSGKTVFAVENEEQASGTQLYSFVYPCGRLYSEVDGRRCGKGKCSFPDGCNLEK